MKGGKRSRRVGEETKYNKRIGREKGNIVERRQRKNMR